MRKSPFLIVGFAALAAAQTPRPASSTLPKTTATSTELLPDEQIQQVLSRLTFGARPGDAEKVRAMGVDKWIAAQLRPERIDDPAVDQLIGHYETLNASTSDLVDTFR